MITKQIWREGYDKANNEGVLVDYGAVPETSPEHTPEKDDSGVPKAGQDKAVMIDI